jgi:hypothetical protein
VKMWIRTLAGLAAGGIIAATVLSQVQAFDINGIQSGMPESVFLELIERRNVLAEQLTEMDGTPIGYKLKRGCLPDCDSNDVSSMEFVGFCEGLLISYQYWYNGTIYEFLKSIGKTNTVRIKLGLPNIKITINSEQGDMLIAEWHDGSTRIDLTYYPGGSIERSYRVPNACFPK